MVTPEQKTKSTILVIDDEKDVLKAIRDTLAREGYDVLTALNGADGISLATDKNPDLILLDLRLPDMNGFDVCRRLKSEPQTAAIPILMVTTRAGDTDKVVGLEIGADDYLTKPYNPLELVARVRVALRRQRPAIAAHAVFKSGPLQLNTEKRIVTLNGKSVSLTRKEFDLLAVLMERPGKAHSRQSLLERVWGAAYDSMQGTVDTHVKTLRKKLGSASSWLETVTGIGYRWAETPEE